MNSMIYNSTASAADDDRGDEEGIPFFRYLAPSASDEGGSKRVWLGRLRGRFDVNVSASDVQGSAVLMTPA